jgi:NAD(P)H-dependent flavin oxidoreductase YrpB (nitropropane dioxygenase family)
VSNQGRGTEEVRRDISTERKQLVDAVADLRTDVRSAARKIPVIAGGALATGLALAAVVAAAKRHRSGD